MADIVWPVGLPQAPLVRSTSEQLGLQTIRSQVSSGPAKVRRRQSLGVDTLPLELICTAAQVETLREFFRDTAMGGALAFAWKHPHTRASIDFRFLSEPKVVGLAPSIGSTTRYRVAFDVEVVPGTEGIADVPPEPPAERPPDPQDFESQEAGDEPGEDDGPEGCEGWAPPDGYAFAGDSVPGEWYGEPEADELGDDEGAGSFLGAGTDGSTNTHGPPEFTGGGPIITP